jgi:hypothetical protein
MELNMKKKIIVDNANSVGLIEDYYGVSSFNYGVLNERAPKFDTAKALKILENDPLVKGAIITLTDKTLESGWRIIAKDKKSRKAELEDKLRELRFDAVLRKALYNLILYNNAFLEIVKKGSEVTDINVLETTFMRIEADDFGNVTGYSQSPLSGSRTKPSWTPDKIVHIKLRDITTNVWASPLDMQTLYETVLLKDYIRQYLTWFFGTNQLRGLYAIESGASEARLKDFLSYLKASEKDKTKPLILQGKVTYQMLNTFGEGDKILKVLDWCDTQILMLLQVPPIAVGQPDASGRSNSVEQFNALNTTVLSIQRILEELFSYDLFPKIGYDKALFDFGVLDQTARMRTFEIAEKMKNMMMTDEAIQEFLESQGIVFNTKVLFKDPVEMAEDMAEATGKLSDTEDMSNDDVAQGSEGMIGNKPHDSAPSRQRQDATGNSVRSKANEKSMVRNAEVKNVTNFGSYPYTFATKE